MRVLNRKALEEAAGVLNNKAVLADWTLYEMRPNLSEDLVWYPVLGPEQLNMPGWKYQLKKEHRK